MRKIAGTLAPSGSVPLCKQCLESDTSQIIDPSTGKVFHAVRGNEHVVRFMGAWACLDHFMVEVKGKSERVPLRELLYNRAHRRQIGGGHRVQTPQASL